MSLIIPDGFGEAVIEFDFLAGASNPLAIVFGYINDGAQSAVQNATIIRDEFESNVMVSSAISNNIQMLRVSVLQNPGGVSAVVASAVTGPGGGSALAPNTSYLIRKSTALGGREGRGRIYMPGPMTSTVNEGGTLTVATITNLNTAFTAFNTNLGSNSIEMYLLHSAAVTAPSPVLSLSADALVATQRRRLR